MYKKLSPIFIIFLLVPGIFGWGENTHQQMTEDLLKKADQDSQIVKTINKHPESYWAGLMDPDKTILYYWLGYPFTLGRQYKDTHKIDYYMECRSRAGSEREMAFCYGSESHGIQDSFSHNILIPSRIKATGLPNVVIHPITELAVDGIYFTPKIQQIYTLEVLEYEDPETGRNLIEFGNSIWDRDMTKEVKLLSRALGSETSAGLWGGYGLPVQKDSSIFSLYQAFVEGNIIIGISMISFSIFLGVLIWKRNYGKFEYIIGFMVVFILGIGLLLLVGVKNMSDPQYATPVISQAKEQMQLFLNYDVGPTMDPAGTESLKAADGPAFVKDIFVLSVAVFLFFVVRKLLRRGK